MTISLQTEIASNFEDNSNITAQNAVFAHYSKDINLKPSFTAKATENACSEENSEGAACGVRVFSKSNVESIKDWTGGILRGVGVAREGVGDSTSDTSV